MKLNINDSSLVVLKPDSLLNPNESIEKNLDMFGGFLKTDSRIFNAFSALLRAIGIFSFKMKVSKIPTDFSKLVLCLTILIANKSKVIIIDEDDVCLRFSEEDWFLWETFIHKIKDTGVIILVISEKRTNLVAVDKLVTVVDKK